MVNPVKIFLTSISSLITMQNLVVVYHTVCMYSRGPKNFGEAGAPPPWDGGMADLTLQKHATPHVLAYQIWSL